MYYTCVETRKIEHCNGQPGRPEREKEGKDSGPFPLHGQAHPCQVHRWQRSSRHPQGLWSSIEHCIRQHCRVPKRYCFYLSYHQFCITLFLFQILKTLLSWLKTRGILALLFAVGQLLYSSAQQMAWRPFQTLSSNLSNFSHPAHLSNKLMSKECFSQL